jgi:hypothetical protein
MRFTGSWRACSGSCDVARLIVGVLGSSMIFRGALCALPQSKVRTALPTKLGDGTRERPGNVERLIATASVSHTSIMAETTMPRHAQTCHTVPQVAAATCCASSLSSAGASLSDPARASSFARAVPCPSFRDHPRLSLLLDGFTPPVALLCRSDKRHTPAGPQSGPGAPVR